MPAKMRRRTAVAVGLMVVLFAREVTAEPIHLKTPSSVKTDGGTDLRLPPGYFLDEPEYKSLDDEMKRLQVRETRLAAENKSLRESADDISFGWYVLSAAVVAGFAAGYLYAK